MKKILLILFAFISCGCAKPVEIKSETVDDPVKSDSVTVQVAETPVVRENSPVKIEKLTSPVQEGERFCIIPEAKAKQWKQYKICWHYGIDPVQIKSGEWVLDENCYYDMTNRFCENNLAAEDSKIRADSVRTELEKYPARVITKDEWKISEEQIEEKTQK